MHLDLRLPMGLMFTLFGVLLVAWGLVSDASLYARSLGVNVNLWWGVVLLLFGAALLGLTRRRRPTPPPTSP